MRVILFTVLTLGTITGCQYYERIYIDDVQSLIDNKIENNLLEIKRVEKELRDEKIDSIRENIDLKKELYTTHFLLSKILDTLDNVDKKDAAAMTMFFIEERYKGTYRFNQSELKINEETPTSLLKLHLANLESFYINDKSRGYHYNDKALAFKKFESFIIPDKTVLKKGEKLRGRIFMAVVPDCADKETIKFLRKKKIIVNGQEVQVSKSTCEFEIQPQGFTSGDNRLNAQIVLEDSIYECSTSIYVRD